MKSKSINKRMGFFLIFTLVIGQLNVQSQTSKIEVKAGATTTASFVDNEELFGPNLRIYGPEDNVSAIAHEINAIHDEMFRDQFSAKRYAFFFKPGDYTEAGTLKVAYYTQINGLGKTPYEVKLSNIDTPAPLKDNNATCTFWRSVENFSIIGTGKEFTWGVSQAAPIRRVYSQRDTRYDKGGWASGGFTADCYFEGAAGSDTQQQWYSRNSFLNHGQGKYAAGNWNTCYQGVEFGAGVNRADHSDNWSSGGKISRVETTPIIREKPFLFFDEDGRYKVFKPALRADSKGVSWGQNRPGEGEAYDLLDDFYVVKPGTSAQTMNQQLANGKHLFITPGMYELSEPLRVNHPNTIVLGTGYATLIHSATNPVSAMIVDDVDGVTIAGLLFDSHYSSHTLLQMGEKESTGNHSENPSLLADLFFRVGGFRNENVNVDIAMEINSSDVIGDHFWIWRADHGRGVGWFKNTSKNGLVVNGHYVTIYGLFNEHFQEYQTLWNGEKGRVYFYQCETPYDPTNQNLYKSHNGTVNGYAAYKVADQVKYHEAAMLGMYDVFVNTKGARIVIENSIEVPNSKEVKVHHACNVRISNVKGAGFNYIINGNTGSTVKARVPGARFFITDFAGTVTPEPFERPEAQK
jgi:hypothetical protein